MSLDLEQGHLIWCISITTQPPWPDSQRCVSQKLKVELVAQVFCHPHQGTELPGPPPWHRAAHKMPCWPCWTPSVSPWLLWNKRPRAVSLSALKQNNSVVAHICFVLGSRLLGMKAALALGTVWFSACSLSSLGPQFPDLLKGLWWGLGWCTWGAGRTVWYWGWKGTAPETSIQCQACLPLQLWTGEAHQLTCREGHAWPRSNQRSQGGNLYRRNTFSFLFINLLGWNHQSLTTHSLCFHQNVLNSCICKDSSLKE